MGFCSAMTLAFATIFSLVSVALLAISFSTDNWITISVNREKIQVNLSIIFVKKNIVLINNNIDIPVE